MMFGPAWATGRLTSNSCGPERKAKREAKKDAKRETKKKTKRETKRDTKRETKRNTNTICILKVIVSFKTHMFCLAWATGRFDLKALWAEKGNKKGHEKGCENGNEKGVQKGDE